MLKKHKPKYFHIQKTPTMQISVIEKQKFYDFKCPYYFLGNQSAFKYKQFFFLVSSLKICMHPEHLSEKHTFLNYAIFSFLFLICYLFNFKFLKINVIFYMNTCNYSLPLSKFGIMVSYIIEVSLVCFPSRSLLIHLGNSR